MPHIAGFRGVLLDRERDPSRAVYRYHQVFQGPGGRSFTRRNLFVAVRLTPWSEGALGRHEAVEPQRAHAPGTRGDGAFVAGYRDPSGEIERLFRRFEAGAPTLELATPDGTTHRIWRVQDAELLGKLRHALAPKKLHLLEGHATYAAMLARQAAAGANLAMYSAANYGLGCLVGLDDPALVTAPRHRVLRGGRGADDALAAARAHFIIERVEHRDLATLFTALGESVAHQPAFLAVFPGERCAWKLTLSPEVSPFAEGIAPDRALQKMNPIAVELFVTRALRPTARSTELDAARALAAVDAGAVAVIAQPVTLDQLLHVDELHQELPAESTALFPAVAPNVVTMIVDPDEDLV